ncbi:DsbA family protein [Colwelliaceae bacterium 6441]
MKMHFIKVFITACLFALLISSCDSESTQKNELKGRYTLVSSLSPNSLTKVNLDVFINFKCPHCYQSHNFLIELQKKYGEQLVINFRPVVEKGKVNDILKLFYIASLNAKELETIKTIYEAVFVKQLDIEDKDVVRNLAIKLGIEDQYVENYKEQWIDNKIKRSITLARAYNLSMTPSMVIESQLKLSNDIKNIDIVLNDLLIKDD